MRLAGQEKMGYYPTPPATLQAVLHFLSAEKGANLKLLDPCAGEGEALATVARHLRMMGACVETFGIELSPERATAAAAVLDHVLNDGAENCVVSNGAFSLLWLNPPYDWGHVEDENNRRERQEYTFLKMFAPKLTNGGVLVYIVPRHLLRRTNVCRYLAANFDHLTVWKLPPGEYEQFNQIAILGIRRRRLADENVVDQLKAIGSNEVEPPTLSTLSDAYTVPSAPTSSKFFFVRLRIKPEEAATLALQHGVYHKKEWNETNTTLEFQPLVPFRRGHLASMLAGGLMGTVRLGNLVVKGRAEKVVHEEREPTEDGDVIIRQTESFLVRLYVLDDDFDLHTIEDAGKLEEFLTEHAVALAALIEKKYRPLYLDPNQDEWAATGGLIPHKRLPGRRETGLLPAQRHTAIALARAVKKYGAALAVAEMGFGKTATSLAAVNVLDGWPAVVICPPHMTQKWVREVEEVIPGAKAVELKSVGDVDRFVAAYRAGVLPRKSVAVVSRERAKLGPGWEHAFKQTWVRTYNEYGERKIIRVLACPDCGRPYEDEDGFLPADRLLPKKRMKCPFCAAPLYQYGGYNRWPVARYIRRQYRGFCKILIADEVHEYKGSTSDQGGAFQDLAVATRGLIGLTGTLFGGKASSLFYILHRTNAHIRRDFEYKDVTRWIKTFGRIERVFRQSEEEDAYYSGRRRQRVQVRELPGISPLVVKYLLPYTVFARVADLGYQLPPFQEEIVRLDMDPEMERAYQSLNATLMEIFRERRKMGDPGMLSVWLQTCLGYPNAAFRRSIVTRTVPKGRKRVPVPVVDGVWQIPRAPKDPIVVRDDGSFLYRRTDGQVLHLQAVIAPQIYDDDTLSPKEKWLVEYVKAEVAQGRKVLVFLRQTGLRDIQPRIEAILKRVGLKVAILPDGKPSERERWIRERLGRGLQVLITNPRKVETGLDLVDFQTAIFFEVEYSLYTLWQSQRRIWRLGQTQPAKVVYAVYRNTLEEAALALIAEKMKSALLLYGDSAESALASEANTGDFLTELANRVLEGNIGADGISAILAHKGDESATLLDGGESHQPQRDWLSLAQELTHIRKKTNRRRKCEQQLQMELPLAV